MTDERIQQTIGTLLRVGVLLSALVVAAGGIWYLASNGGSPAAYSANAPAPAEAPQRMIMAGLILLIATPVARVAFALAAFALEKDYAYVAISAIVLAVLLLSIGSSFW